ncbi:hypothetical protein TSTA_099690 [Talaromyces stipitatus ATCC 10500]|uniref:Uncharacterized protein n=1 Tax=Talaromyces stipitatus (strain ATCC 10500 / CBS 375.48 / QM 6759 / NRRL 1006) TaxID=441959 RepID=B8MMG5_TALSN|nr:uncharacterized protein TSTA_099690 [Talaromyces stipitatus ATCC 10500]EED13719.1 hypothetical protein TSTA_099690 [Talaromyces stipitatus ATCC 10500]
MSLEVIGPSPHTKIEKLLSVGPHEVAKHHQSLLPKTEAVTTKQSHLSLTPPAEHQTTLYKRSSSAWNTISWKLEILSWIGSLCLFIAIIVVLKVVDGTSTAGFTAWHPAQRNRRVVGHLWGISFDYAREIRPWADEMAPMASKAANGQFPGFRSSESRAIRKYITYGWSRGGALGMGTPNKIPVELTHPRPLGSFGASLIIVALGISAFTQQPLKYDTVYPHTDEAYMPIAQFMNDGFDTELLAAPDIALFSPAHTNFTAAFISRGGGSSSNCTWESYQTLGVRSTCKDLSSSLNMSK